MKTLTETFNEVTVKKGETFKIDLDSNATTGYTWQFKVVAGKARLVGEDYYTPEPFSDPAVCGMGGRQVAAFKAEESGEIEIKAEYLRPWDKSDVARQQTFKITVK